MTISELRAKLAAAEKELAGGPPGGKSWLDWVKLIMEIIKQILDNLDNQPTPGPTPL